MKTYYVGNIPFNGEDSISHGRTFGSKNGISHTPGYIAKGKRAKGPQLVTDSGTGTVQKKKKSLWSTVSGAASSAARSVGRTATSAARTVGKTASSAYGSASKAAKSAYSSGKEFITGSNAKQKRAADQKASSDISRRSSTSRKIASRYGKTAGMERDAFRGLASDPNIIRRIKNRKTIHTYAVQAKLNQASADRARKEAVQSDRLNERDKKMNEGLYKKQRNKTLVGVLEKSKNKAVSTIKIGVSNASEKVKGFVKDLFKRKVTVTTYGSYFTPGAGSSSFTSTHEYYEYSWPFSGTEPVKKKK